MAVWSHDAGPLVNDEFHPDECPDVVIAGAGIVGLVSAINLAKRGHRVTVLEARESGCLTTGLSSGKVSLLTGTTLSTIARRRSPSVVRAYVDAGRAGQTWLHEFLDQQNIPYELLPAYSYAVTEQGADRLEQEYQVARGSGLNVIDVHGDIGLPFPTRQAISLDDQIQVNPAVLVRQLAIEAKTRGVRLVDGCLVKSVHKHKKIRDTVTYRVETSRGTMHGKRVIITTGTPLLDRGGHFARLKPSRTYLRAYQDTRGYARTGMYLSVDKHQRTIRSADVGREQYLFVGGASHPVGRIDSEHHAVKELETWASAQFHVGEPDYRWSAQDYRPADGAPYVGPLRPGEHGIVVATGFNKWGLVNGTAAGLALSSWFDGDPVAWSRELYSRKPSTEGLFASVRAGAGVAKQIALGVQRVVTTRPASTPANNSGEVYLEKGRPTAACRVENEVHRFSAVCPHMGGILKWNDEENSWDCPLHGSRFAADGTRLEGPATSNLKKR